MADNSLDLRYQQDEHQNWTNRQKRKITEKDCGEYILEKYRDIIVKHLVKISIGEMLIIEALIDDGSVLKSLTFSAYKPEDLEYVNLAFRQNTGLTYLDLQFPAIVLNSLIEEGIKLKEVLVCINWRYTEDAIDEIAEQIVNVPVSYISSVKRPFQWASEIKKQPNSKKSKPLERELEADLLSWLHNRGIQADNQISTTKHRMDLWIPRLCFLELKSGKVSGDDVCQSIDYCAEYKLPVILVGNHIGTMASRGIEAFNKAVGSDMITFVQWSAIKTYLKGLLF